MYEQWAECASCHAVDGTGNVEGLELDPPPPDFTDCSLTSREPSKDWFAVIKHGGPVRGLSSTMPEYQEATKLKILSTIYSGCKVATMAASK